MRRTIAACLASSLLVLAAQPAGSTAWSFTAAPEAIREHIHFLARDALGGRAPGSPGYDVAAAYVADQFREMGLKPGGDRGSYLQTVNLIRHRAVAAGTLRVIGGSGEPVDLVRQTDFRPSTTAHGKTVSVAGQAVFVGHGVVAPGQNDYEGLNVRGKIVVALEGGPTSIPRGDANFVTSSRAKALMAKKNGAVGLILVAPTEFPAAAAAAAPPPPGRANQGSWTWETRNGDGGYGGVPVLATVDPSGAAALFAGAPQTYAAVATAAATNRPVPKFNLARRIDVTAEGALGERAPSSNVVAIIEGTDPVLKRQYVVMSGHLDHVGVLTTTPANGDAINNGALDNAAGIATLIEAARGFAEGPRPKRSVIFLAVTAEERGLLGSDFFVHNPTVPKASIIANVNLDMPVMTYDFTDVAAIGAEHSTIVEAVRRAAGRMNVAISPDPVPELGIFTRSDHYRFVENGIPAVFLIGGFQNGGEAKFRDFYANRYHKPGDDLNQALDYQAGAKWARLQYEIAWELANQPERPVFNKTSLFGVRFAAPDAIAR